ncbi:glycosyltransferase family protein [Actibacterium pelagium]|uniref:Glycosyl transferase family 2 n=1 Tax=Actibacterium pelagium TaxID=2029103 RepID=A0A917EGW1_9RHOB|nr:hypothetical protein [Actibacterium pelagium]GGE39704.1 hypothetical protein GCM10011517_04270 [Actibacterium pelagium]
MLHRSLTAFLKSPALWAKGPLALIFDEDGVEVESTLRHHLKLGFATVALFTEEPDLVPEDLKDQVETVDFEAPRRARVTEAVNRVIDAAPGRWMFYCYNAEYLYFPYCETRKVGELLTFHTEERRDAMLTYVIDLYAGDLDQFPNAVSREQALLDSSGYYALRREDPVNGYAHKDRQMDFFGGLRWRFEEHVPWTRRRIDRISLFKAKAGLELLTDHTFTDEEYNTYSCEWHHNLTAAVCSFRAAKALKSNPGSREEITDFRWRKSVPFDWHSQQLLELGLIEPGQWF